MIIVHEAYVSKHQSPQSYLKTLALSCAEQFRQFIPLIPIREELIEHIEPLPPGGSSHFSMITYFMFTINEGIFIMLSVTNRETKTQKDQVSHRGPRS